MREALTDLTLTMRRDSAFALYLLALAGLGLKWLSPLSALNERAIWSDVLVAASATVWAWESLRAGGRPRIRAFHVALGLFLAAGALSMLFAGDRTTAVENVVVMAELCILALLTSHFAADARRLNAIVLVVCLVALYTALLAVVGIGLFYAGVETSLLGVYGSLMPSEDYARVAAGFESPPLLASFCIFASALIARDDTTLPVAVRRATQVALAALVLATFSRAAIAFAAAVAIRVGYAHRRSRAVRIAAAWAVACAVALTVGLTIGHLQVDPTDPASTTYEVPGAENGRWDYLGDGVDAFADRPLVGQGPGELTARFDGQALRAHMTALNIAATMGIPALAAIAFLLVTLWRNRRRPTPIATWSGIAGLGLDGLAHDIDHFRHVWALLGLADAERRPDPPPNRRPGRLRGVR
jgi:hypothetical protein